MHCAPCWTQVGPKIEFSKGEIFEDEEIAKILPFLALPDGAHLVSHDVYAAPMEAVLITQHMIDDGRLLVLPFGAINTEPDHPLRYLVSLSHALCSHGTDANMGVQM